MRSTALIKLIQSKHPHRCYVCDETIDVGPLVRVAWGGLNPGFGFFHLKLCYDAILIQLKKDYEIVYDSEDGKTGTHA